MPGSDLFLSGRAEVNPAYEVRLQHVAVALNKVRGAVTIIGHTDNQPIKSLVYSDNYELSRARAVSVANVLGRTLDKSINPAVRGAGSGQPVAAGSDAESRARNRRVEIIHVR
jgi:type VI secretion system protein ImpK